MEKTPETTELTNEQLLTPVEYRTDDTTFSSLLPTFKGTESYEILKEFIRANGRIPGTMYVWDEKNLLIDGYHRHWIAEELRAEGVPVEMPTPERKSFDSIAAAKLFVLNNQDARRPEWTTMERVEILEKDADLQALWTAEAEKRQRAGVKIDLDSTVESTPAKRKGRVIEKKAERAGCSVGSYHNYQTILADPEMHRRVKEKEITVKQALNVIKKEKSRQNNYADKTAIVAAIQELKKQEVAAGLDYIDCADVLDALRKLPRESVNLIFTSPPYPIGTVAYHKWKYEGYGKYLAWLEKVWRECERIIRPGGNLVVNFDNTFPPAVDRKLDGKKLRHDCFTDFANQMKSIGLNYSDTIIWYKQKCVGEKFVGTHADPRSTRHTQNWEFVNVYRKGTKSLMPQTAGALYDLTSDQRLKLMMGHWAIDPERRTRSNHCAAFPQQLAENVVRMYSYVGDTVLDPFSGTGTTCAMAAKYGRHYIGIDNDPVQCAKAVKRAEKAKAESPELPPTPKPRPRKNPKVFRHERPTA